MFIGFTQRIRSISESDVPEGKYLYIRIALATLRLAERVHPMIFRLQSGGTAIVGPYFNVQYQAYDALFESDAPIQVEYRVNTIPPLIVRIRDDLRPEDEECFTIPIFPRDVPGRRELFDCNEDEDGATNYFCETTICIEDNDGKFSSKFFP